MFKISTKGDYGLLVLSALAESLQQGIDRVSLKEIAKSKRLSLSYISQIILPLKKAGLVISREGKGGGYSLTKPANRISLMEILEALEGPITPVRCCGPISCAGKKTKKSCGREEICNAKATWQDAKNAVMNVLKNKTLEDTINSKT